VLRMQAQGQAVDMDVFRVQQELSAAQAEQTRLLGMASLAQFRLQAQTDQTGLRWSQAPKVPSSEALKAQP